MYYSFKRLFLESLCKGKILLWDPYFGAGAPAMCWVHIPVNQYTLFNLIFGAGLKTELVFRICDFALLQVCYYFFCRDIKLPSPLCLIAGLFYFDLNYVRFGFIYPYDINMYIFFPFITMFVFRYCKGQLNYRNLIFIILFINLSLLSGRPEFVFINMVVFTFVFFVSAYFFCIRAANNLKVRCKMLMKVFCHYVIINISVLAISGWHLFLVYNYLKRSYRVKGGILSSIFSFHWVKDFLLSLVYSEFFVFSMILGGVFFVLHYIYHICKRKGEICSRSLVLIVFIVGVVFLSPLQEVLFSCNPFGPRLDIFESIPYFLRSFGFRIFLILCALKLFFDITLKTLRTYSLREVWFIPCSIFLFAYIYTQPPEYMPRMDLQFFHSLNPLIRESFMIMAMIGLCNYRKSMTILICWVCMLLIYFMRSHVQILMLHSGMAWFIQRDNCWIDFFSIIIALYGMKYSYEYIVEIITFYGRNKKGAYKYVEMYFTSICIMLVFVFGASLFRVAKVQGFQTHYISDHKYFSDIFKKTSDRLLKNMEESDNLFRYSSARMLTDINRTYYHYTIFRHLHLAEVDVFDSLTPRYYTEFIKKRIMEGFAPYVNYPINVLKVLGIQLNNEKDRKNQEIYWDQIFKEIPYPLNENQLKLLNVKYIVSHKPPEAFLDNPCFSHLDSFQSMKRPAEIEDEKFVNVDKSLDLFNKTFYIYKNDCVLSRFFLANDYKVISEDRQLLNILFKTGTDVSKVAFFNESYPELSQFHLNDGSDKGFMGDVKVKHYSPHDIAVETNSPEDSILILTDTWDEDWRVFVDDKPQRILRVDHAFRGVPLAKGAHKVTFRYHLKYFYPLLILACIGWIVLLGIIVRTRGAKN